MKIVNENNYYTLYWHNGDRNIVKGVSIEEAFTKAGYGAGAINALCWYDEGVSETHHYNKDKKIWVKYEPIHYHYDDIRWENPSLISEFKNALKEHRSIIVEFKNKDRYILEHNQGLFSFSKNDLRWVKYLQITYGEYSESYLDDDNDTGCFMTTNTEYFDPEKPELAIEAFIERGPVPYKYSTSSHSKKLTELKSI